MKTGDSERRKRKSDAFLVVIGLLLGFALQLLYGGLTDVENLIVPTAKYPVELAIGDVLAGAIILCIAIGMTRPWLKGLKD